MYNYYVGGIVKMGITKKIICISCGKSFLVDRDEYDERLEESLCDKCREEIAEAENINDADVFSKVGETVARIATSVSGKINEMLQERANKSDERKRKEVRSQG